MHKVCLYRWNEWFEQKDQFQVAFHINQFFVERLGGVDFTRHNVNDQRFLHFQCDFGFSFASFALEDFDILQIQNPGCQDGIVVVQQNEFEDMHKFSVIGIDGSQASLDTFENFIRFWHFAAANRNMTFSKPDNILIDKYSPCFVTFTEPKKSPKSTGNFHSFRLFLYPSILFSVIIQHQQSEITQKNYQLTKICFIFAQTESKSNRSITVASCIDAVAIKDKAGAVVLFYQTCLQESDCMRQLFNSWTLLV